jgi:hypothetical protein
MMVKYNKKLHRLRKERTFDAPMSTEINFDPDKILDKVNNHMSVKTPNFDLMLSRPEDNGPLPSFMKVFATFNLLHLEHSQQTIYRDHYRKNIENE